ncbi:hypothetical protein ILUMI_02305 [Ignelater luminosus]|uniref:Uncharacterized protein n=1 Tax=Ignelater luminosus TaxID=2038154 RepID=A0A8K0GKY3_IGNLU|nr:hypothetical protein ILUMI_02305 [Ignelater luminosus]
MGCVLTIEITREWVPRYLGIQGAAKKIIAEENQSHKKKTQYEDMECTEERGATQKENWAAGYSAMSKLDQQLDEESIFGRKSKLSTSPAGARAFTYAESKDEEKDEETAREA